MHAVEDIRLHEKLPGTYTIYGFPPECSRLIESNTNEGKTYQQYCLIDLPNGEEKFQICDNNRELKSRILAISMIASITFLVLTILIIWKRNKEKLHGAMTLNMIIMLITYFLLTMLANFVHTSDYQCHVSNLFYNLTAYLCPCVATNASHRSPPIFSGFYIFMYIRGLPIART